VAAVSDGVQSGEAEVPDARHSDGEDPAGVQSPVQSRDDGQLHFTPETAGTTFPVTAPADATPLEEDEPEGTIPPSPLWAMKERRHEQWFHFGHPDRIRECVGAGDAAVYAIDDGKHHCMIGRRVGATLDGCVYSLVARVAKDTYESMKSGAINGRQAFLASSESGLSGTVEDPGVSNVFDVDYYQHAGDIPGEYLPPAAFIEFAEDLPSADR
jgi:hypothetical protein